MTKAHYFLESVCGAQLEACIEPLAELRIRVFAEYPYLYAGDLDYEHRYLRAFAQAQDALVVTVKDDNGKLVGCSTGSAILSQHKAFIEPLANAGIALDSTFYFGESVLLQEWRGQGIGHQFFDRREAFASQHHYRRACFCAVIREPDHPQQPQDYRSLNTFWHKRGYQQLPEAVGHFDWPETYNGPQVSHPMGYWLRELSL